MLAQAVSDLLPSWADLVACPKVHISMSGRREPCSVEQYIVGQISVLDPEGLFPGIPDPAMPGHLAALAPFHYHHRPPRERLEATLRLIPLRDQQPGTPGLSSQSHPLEGQPPRAAAACRRSSRRAPTWPCPRPPATPYRAQGLAIYGRRTPKIVAICSKNISFISMVFS